MKSKKFVACALSVVMFFSVFLSTSINGALSTYAEGTSSEIGKIFDCFEVTIKGGVKDYTFTTSDEALKATTSGAAVRGVSEPTAALITSGSPLSTSYTTDIPAGTEKTVVFKLAGSYKDNDAATSGNALGIKVSQNGVAAAEVEPTGSASDWTYTVTLQEGENKLEFTPRSGTAWQGTDPYSATWVITIGASGSVTYGSTADYAKTLSVANGTAKEQVISQLPTKIGVNGTGTAGNVTGEATVVWTMATYNQNAAGNYTATGVVTLPGGWTGPVADLTVTVTVLAPGILPETQVTYLSTGSYINIADVANGTPVTEAMLRLPQTVEVIGKIGSTETTTTTTAALATVTWTSADYNQSVAGSYTATGGVTLPANWSGSIPNLTATVRVGSDAPVVPSVGTVFDYYNVSFVNRLTNTGTPLVEAPAILDHVATTTVAYDKAGSVVFTPKTDNTKLDIVAWLYPYVGDENSKTFEDISVTVDDNGVCTVPLEHGKNILSLGAVSAAGHSEYIQWKIQLIPEALSAQYFTVNNNLKGVVTKVNDKTYNVNFSLPSTTNKFSFAFNQMNGFISMDEILEGIACSSVSEVGNSLVYDLSFTSSNSASAATGRMGLTFRSADDYTYNINFARPAVNSNSGSSSNSGSGSGSGTPTATAAPKATTAPSQTPVSKDNDVLAQIKSGKNLAVAVTAEKPTLGITGETLASVVDSGKPLTITNGTVSMDVSPALIESLNLKEDAKVEITIVLAADIKVAATGDERTDKVNEALLSNAVSITMKVNGKETASFDQPIPLVFDLKAANLTTAEKAKVTGVRFLQNGKRNQLGGTFKSDGSFETKTSKLSTYGVLLSDNLVKITTSIGKYSYDVNGKTNQADVAPVIMDSHTMVPVRFIAEAFGADVSWTDSTKTVTIKLDGETMNLRIGEKAAGMDVAPVIVNERTLVPLRYISEKFGSNVLWTDKTKTVEIYR